VRLLCGSNLLKTLDICIEDLVDIYKCSYGWPFGYDPWSIWKVATKDAKRDTCYMQIGSARYQMIRLDLNPYKQNM
jgi:hypothetical protein